MKVSKNNALIFLFFFILVFSLKYNILDKPFHWDETSIDIPAAVWMHDNSFNLMAGEVSNGHPPLSYFLIALSFKILGVTLFAAKLPFLLSTVIGIYYLYKIGSFTYTKFTGFLAALAAFLIPIVFSQSGITISTNLLISLFPLTLYYYLKKDYILYSLFAAFSVMVHETAMVYVATIFLTELILILKTKQKQTKKQIYMLLPFIIFLIWLILNKINFGWFLLPKNTAFLTFNPITILLNILKRGYIMFISQYKFILLLPVLLTVIGKRKKSELKFEIISYTIMISYILFYSFIEEAFLLRYPVFLYPLLTILSFGSIYRLMDRKVVILPTLTFFIITSALFVSGWHGTRDIPPGWQLETNMEYIDSVNTHIDATEYIEKNYNNSLVLTCWPMIMELKHPYLGYVKNEIKHRDYIETNSLDNIDIIYFSRQSNCYNLPDEIDISKFQIEKKYELNGKNAIIYTRVSQ